jgi:hypothetical protein
MPPSTSSPAPPGRPPQAAQCADAVLLLRPSAFGWNAQTAVTNRFQVPPPPCNLQSLAVAEFDGLADALAVSGVEVHALADRADPPCPDALFPNNWVSLHADGTAVLYPMLAPNRRLERRPELLAELVQRGGFRIERLLDLTHHELDGRFLEGTGSVVFDHVSRAAYACLSPRSDAAVLCELCEEIDYEPVVFRATGPAGAPVYHTNVMLAIGSRFVVVCADAVDAGQRQALLERLGSCGRHVETIDEAQMASFAGNLLELRSRAGGSVLAVSARGFESLAPAARERLASCVERVVAAPVPTIEDTGGGSVRCMLAEVFLPRAADRPESGAA